MKLLFENWREYKASILSEIINPATIDKIETALIRAGGESYIVGGAVRDELLPDTPSSKDIDFLVRNLELHQIANALSHLGKVKEVGQAFGVVTATIDGEDFDFAIPRTAETKTGEKHTEFDVETDPNAPIETDLGRRDFAAKKIFEIKSLELSVIQMTAFEKIHCACYEQFNLQLDLILILSLKPLRQLEKILINLILFLKNAFY